MEPQPSTSSGHGRRTGILPLRGAPRYAPSSAALHVAAEGLPAVRARVVEAVVFWVAERARAAASGSVWWSEAILFDGPACAVETGHALHEVMQARDDARDIGVLVGEGRVQVSAELIAELPALAEVDWSAVRSGLGGAVALPACLAVVRELARRAERSEWIALSRGELASAVSWGQTRVTQALRDLEAGKLLERAPGNGLCVRLTPCVWGIEDPRPDDPPPSSRAGVPPTPASASGAGVILRVGGAELHLPPGQRYRLTFADDGGPVIEIG